MYRPGAPKYTNKGVRLVNSKAIWATKWGGKMKAVKEGRDSEERRNWKNRQQRNHNNNNYNKTSSFSEPRCQL